MWLHEKIGRRGSRLYVLGEAGRGFCLGFHCCIARRFGQDTMGFTSSRIITLRTFRIIRASSMYVTCHNEPFVNTE
jgi:hypothetical protein